jgi:mono/diheme cytochrome c family protein
VILTTHKEKTMLWTLRTAALGASLLAAFIAPVWAASSGNLCGFTGGNPDKGANLYAQSCAACHGDDGRGTIPGAPDFTKKGGVLSKPASRLTDRLQNGFSSPGSPISMPPRGGNPNLSNQDIRDIHAYLYKSFGCG